MTTSRLFIALFLAASWGYSSKAADIVVYDFAGQPGNQAFTPPSFEDAPFEFVDLSRNPSMIAGPTLAASMNSSIAYGGPAEDRALTWYGLKSDQSAWDFNYVWTGYAMSTVLGSVPTQVNLDLSIDAGQTWSTLGIQNLSGLSGDLAYSFPTFTVPAGTASGAIFKLTVIGGSGPSTTFALTNGSFGGLKVGIAVPEPSSYALGAIGFVVFGLLGRHRSRKAKSLVSLTFQVSPLHPG